MAEVTSISGATLEKAKKELFEVPEERLDKIAELRERITVVERSSDHTAVVFVRKDDSFLLRFLRAKKFDVERSLQLYLNYYKYRHKYAEVIGDLTVQSVQHVLHKGLFGLLDTPTKSGSKVIVVFPSRVDLDKVPPIDCFRALLLIMDKLIEDEEAQVHGLAMVAEFEGVSLFQVVLASTTEFARSSIVFDLIQDAFPARFKSLHMVRQPWYVSILYKLAKPFIKQKMKERIYMHGADMTGLYSSIAQSELPADFGGPHPPLSSSSLLNLLGSSTD